jgi:hypothetical protein
MKVKANSLLGWVIHIAFAVLMGWFIGYTLIPGVASILFAVAAPEWIRIALSVGCGAFYLYLYRSGFDTAFPFKNGGWLK